MTTWVFLHAFSARVLMNFHMRFCLQCARIAHARFISRPILGEHLGTLVSDQT
jgi:hypothetical protein